MTNVQYVAQFSVVIVIALLTLIGGLLTVIAGRSWSALKEAKEGIEELRKKIDTMRTSVIEEFDKMCTNRQAACNNTLQVRFDNIKEKQEDNKEDIKKLKEK